MKHLQRMLAFLFLAFILQNCVKEEDALPQQVQFSVDLKLTDASGARISALPDGTMLRVSIQTGSGDPVLTDHSMELLSFGGGYMTEPIELNPGRYKIVDFFLIHGSQVLYATPKKGSPLAGAVVHPLEYGFNVGNNKVSNIEMEVVDANQRVPEDFGYLSFNIGIVNTFQLSVFTEEDGQFSLASATAHILNGTDTVRSFDLKNKINLLSFQGEADGTYSLTVIKNGYGRFTREFNISDLNDELDNKPLKVYLEPALTMLAQVVKIPRNNPSYYYPFNLEVISSDGDITVDWGDGTTDSYNLEYSQNTVHAYPSEGDYFVSITGDLHVISHLAFTGSGISEINLDHLPELLGFAMWSPRGPKTLDLTHNPKIGTIVFDYTSDIKNIKLPISHDMHDLRITVPSSQITTGTVDSLINNIHANAINKNIKDGEIYLKNYDPFEFYPDPNPYRPMIGPPSEEALVKLRELRDVYGWYIEPEDF